MEAYWFWEPGERFESYTLYQINYNMGGHSNVQQITS